MSKWVSNDELEVPEAALQSLGQAAPSPDYVPCPEHPLSPDYVPGPEYLVPSDDKIPIEDQPLHVDASPTALSPGYVAGSDPEEDPELKMIQSRVASPSPVPPPRLHRARISIRPQTPMSAATEALIAAVAAALPSSPPPSPLTSLSSPLPQIPLPSLPFLSPPLPLPSPSLPLLLPATDPRLISAAVAARQHGLDVTHAIDYNFVDIVDATPGRPMSRETTLEELSQRVTDLAATLARDTHEMYVRFEDAQDDRALQRARVNTLFRDKRYHLHTAMLLESEARQGTEDQRTREPEPARDLEPQDGPADVGSSC
ncbi:hypothetical protein Tco_1189083 [Tanacetum coccineum]